MSASPQKTVSASPKSSPSKKEIDAATAALNHFAQGKRHLVVGDVQSAVNSLQEACRCLAEEYGETAPECGDAYFHYGKALLEMARIESGVLGNALDGVPEGEDMDNSQVESAEKATEEEWATVSKDVSDALEENFKGLEKNVKTEKENEKEAVAESSKGASVLNGDGSEDEGIENPSRDVSDESSDAGGMGKLEVVECEKSELELSSDLSKDNVTSGGDMETEMDTSIQKGEKRKGPDGNSKEADKMVKDLEKEKDGKDAVDEKKEGSTEEEDDDDEDDDEEDEDGDSQEGDSQDEEGSKEETEGNTESKSKDEEGEKTEEDDEEVSNLQLSWEMLELSKMIFQKQEKSNPEMTKKVAQVYLTLGEVGLESENYAQGIEDFKKCLEIQEKNLEADNRCLAETHYHLGVAFSFSDDFDKAVEHFQAAVNVIESRISNLDKKMTEKEAWTEEQKKKDAEVRPDPFYTEQGEIEELNKLLPEIKEKIVDMEEMKKDSKEKLQKAAQAALMAQTIGGRAPVSDPGSQSGFDAPSSSSTSEAKSITHLVRKKRKSEEEAAAEVKKPKVENGEPTNGETTSTNGKPDSMEIEEKKSSKDQSMEDLKKKAAEEMTKATKEITKEHPKVTT